VTGKELFAAEEEEEFDDEDDDYGEFEDEAAGLIELVDHEAVELAGGAEFLVYGGAVVRDADWRFQAFRIPSMGERTVRV